MTAPTASECAADPTLCPKCGSKRTAINRNGVDRFGRPTFLPWRACLDCWHEWRSR